MYRQKMIGLKPSFSSDSPAQRPDGASQGAASATHQDVLAGAGSGSAAIPAPARHGLIVASFVSAAPDQHCTTDAQCGYDYLCDTTRHLCYPPRDCFAWAKLWRGGLVYYGGLILATAYAVYYTRRANIRFLRVAFRPIAKRT